ncbi:MAG TPA: hypothetical protein VJC00_03675 [Candidatus Nanoarchaeia archaeon]|nr:hypothetical protein [Candidatus Nanoarchaeia archaeon]
MYKKRAVILAAVVIIIVLSMVFITSNYYYRKNAQTLIDALKIMRSDSEKGFEMCGEIAITDYAKDCYATYLSVEIENVRARNPGYENLTGEQKKEVMISMLNEISEKADKVCSIRLMKEESITCEQVQSVIELQKDNTISS